MREIKFRGQRKFENHCWVYGYMVKEACGDVWIFPEGDTYCNAGGDFYSENEPGICMVNPETVGQYTGLKDKNGKEIYEGDIFVRDSNMMASDSPYCVRYKHGSWIGVDANSGWLTLIEEADEPYRDDLFYIEVIGNIHDNPELLKKG